MAYDLSAGKWIPHLKAYSRSWQLILGISWGFPAASAPWTLYLASSFGNIAVCIIVCMLMLVHMEAC